MKAWIPVLAGLAGLLGSGCRHLPPPEPAVPAVSQSAFDAKVFCVSEVSRASLIGGVFPDEPKRRAVAAWIAAKISAGSVATGSAEGCARPLREALEEIASGNPDDLVKENKLGFLLLGAEAKHPSLAPALRATLEADQGDTVWLAVLMDANREAGLAALHEWFAQTARGLREQQRLSTLSSELYGKAISAPDSRGLEDVRLTSPLLFARYLSELASPATPLDETSMSALLIVYALQGASSRRLHQDAFANLARSKEAFFLGALRREHPLVQFRLLPTLARAKSPALVRELFWIAANHRDVRVKSLASSLLDTGF